MPIAASLFANMLFEFIGKMLKPGQQGRRGSRCEGAKGISWPKQSCVPLQCFNVARLALARLNRRKCFGRPRKTIATRRAEATGLLLEKLFKIQQHAYRASFIVEYNHLPGAHTRSRFRKRRVLHWQVEMRLNQKVRRCTARQESSEFEAVPHTSRMVLKYFTYWRSHRQFKCAGVLNFATDAIDFSTGVVCQTKRFEPGRPIVDDVR